MLEEQISGPEVRIRYLPSTKQERHVLSRDVRISVGMQGKCVFLRGRVQ
jgi:hypothetical protein